MLVAAALRLWRLDDVPGALQFDESFNAHDILNVLGGVHPIFFRDNFGREPLFIYAQALAVWGLGAKLYALRITAAAFGLLAVPATYTAVRRLVGATPALVAAAWVATVPWALISSRVGLRGVAIPAFVALGIYFFARALDERGESAALRCAVWGALALSLGIYTYVTGRVAPLIPGLVYAAAALRTPSERRRLLRLALVATSVATVVVAPLGLYFTLHPDDFWARANALATDLARETAGGGQLRGLMRGGVGTLGAFLVRGDEAADHNVAFRPIFDPLTGVLFLVGVLAAARQIGRGRGTIWLLVWLVVGLMPNVLTTAGPPC